MAASLGTYSHFGIPTTQEGIGNPVTFFMAVKKPWLTIIRLIVKCTYKLTAGLKVETNVINSISLILLSVTSEYG